MMRIIEITKEEYDIIQTTEEMLEDEPDTLERLLDSIYRGKVIEE